MPSYSSKSVSRPFEDLDVLIKSKKIKLARQRTSAPQRPASDRFGVPEHHRPGEVLSAEQEAELFVEAMKGVTPLLCDRYMPIPRARIRFQAFCNQEEQEVMGSMEQLVQSGEGFVVSQTAEYMEVSGPGASPEITRRLHNGYYAVQDYVDLHGMRVPEAETVLHDFIRQALTRGYRTVLIIHGRGLTSPGEPVLKFKTYEWLTQGPLRKHVIAMTSARSCDGGAGATYVLMRRRPATKRLRKRSGA